MPAEAPADLRRFAGHWSGTETVGASQWAAAGEATSDVVADVEGLYLLQRYTQFRGGQPSFAALNVLGRDAADGRVKLYAFDSAGYLPPSPASGEWRDGTLVLERRSPRGAQRLEYAFADEDHYTMIVRFAPADAPENWQDVVRGTFQRAGQTSPAS